MKDQYEGNMVEQTSGLFSVVVLHYRQLKLWKTAVDSVLKQNYPAIELIFLDDGTKGFEEKEVQNYIEQKAEKNMRKVKIIVNKINMGTVKSLNKAHEFCTGHYITHLAADDAYYDENVFSEYAKHLENSGNDVCGIYGRCLKCDSRLNPTGEEFVEPKEAEEANYISARKQFEKMALRCFVPIGATAFLREQFNQLMPFDESYYLIEDWPFCLKATRTGKRFVFYNFPALLYRDGGVTTAEGQKRSEVQKKCYYDHIKIHDHEIWPYTRMLSYSKLRDLTNRYDYDKYLMRPVLEGIPFLKRINILKRDWRYAWIQWEKIKDKRFGADRKEIYQNLKEYLFSPYR